MAPVTQLLKSDQKLISCSLDKTCKYWTQDQGIFQLSAVQKIDAAAVYMDQNIIILASGVVVSTP